MTQDDLAVLERGRIPAEPIISAVRQYVRENSPPPLVDRNGRSNFDLTPLVIVSERTGISYETLVTWFESSRSVGPMPFDVADALLCACDLFGLWYGELREFYLAVDLSWRQCQAPDCAIMFREGRVKRGPTVKRYCSKNCADVATRIERGEQTRRVKNYGSRLAPRQPIKGVMKCRNGHERTPENTIHRQDGRIACRVCNNAASKAGYHRRRRQQAAC